MKNLSRKLRRDDSGLLTSHFFHRHNSKAQWSHLIFQFAYPFQSQSGSGVDSAYRKNQWKDSSCWVKRCRRIRLTSSLPTVSPFSITSRSLGVSKSCVSLGSLTELDSFLRLAFNFYSKELNVPNTVSVSVFGQKVGGHLLCRLHSRCSCTVAHSAVVEASCCLGTTP
jgi:hypothetical protein